MAHNLNEVNGKVSFAGTAKAWHGLGQIVETAMTAEQALELAGLNFEVKKIPVVVKSNGLDLEMPDKFLTYRTDLNQALGVVGARYEVLQNKDAFSFFDTIIEESEAVYETAGALGKGEKIFITAKMPEHIRITGTDDLTEVYVLLTSSHDGSGTVTAAITPIRVVCQNTLNAALRSTQNKIHIRHTTNLKFNLAQAHKLMGITNSLTTELNSCFNSLATKSITDAKVKELITELFTSQKDDSTRITNIRDAVFASYSAGIGQDKIVGTAWGAYNGITHYLDHEKSYKNADVKFMNVIDGESAKTAQKAFELLINL